MSEIIKLYENAGIEPIDSKLEPMRTLKFNTDSIGNTWTREQYMKEVPIYPPFTAEKQLGLVKWLAKIYELSINWDKQHNSYRFVIRNYENGRLNHCVCGYEVPFEETLVYLINRIWQSLTDQEKEETRRILNE